MTATIRIDSTAQAIDVCRSLPCRRPPHFRVGDLASCPQKTRWRGGGGREASRRNGRAGRKGSRGGGFMGGAGPPPPPPFHPIPAAGTAPPARSARGPRPVCVGGRLSERSRGRLMARLGRQDEPATEYRSKQRLKAHMTTDAEDEPATEAAQSQCRSGPIQVQKQPNPSTEVARSQHRRGPIPLVRMPPSGARPGTAGPEAAASDEPVRCIRQPQCQ